MSNYFYMYLIDKRSKGLSPSLIQWKGSCTLTSAVSQPAVDKHWVIITWPTFVQTCPRFDKLMCSVIILMSTASLNKHFLLKRGWYDATFFIIRQMCVQQNMCQRLREVKWVQIAQCVAGPLGFALLPMQTLHFSLWRSWCAAKYQVLCCWMRRV